MNNTSIENKSDIKDFCKSLPVFIFLVSSDYKIIGLKSIPDAILGYQKKEIIGKNFLDFFEEEQVSSLKKLFSKKGVEEGDQEEFVMLTKDEGKHSVVLNLFFLDNNSFFVSVVVDVTERNKMQKVFDSQIYFLESLRKINQSLHKSSDIEEAMNSVLDMTREVLKCDRAWFVYPCDPKTETWSVPYVSENPEYPGLSPVDNVPIDDYVKSSFSLFLEENKPVLLDSLHPPKIPYKESYLAQSQIAMVIYPRAGKPWVFGIHQCSYARLWAEEDVELFNEIGLRITDALSSLLLLKNLQNSENQFRSLVQTAPVLIIHLDKEGKIVGFNDEAEKMFKKKEVDVVGDFFQNLFSDEDTKKNALAYVNRTITGEAVRNFECEFGGSYINWGMDAQFDIDKKITGIIVAGQDITDIKTTQEVLNKKIKELEKINRLMVGRELKMLELKRKVKEKGSDKLTADS